jgi:hypothetical protein
MCSDDSAPKYPAPGKPSAADLATRRQITPEEEEEWIRYDEKRLETLSGEQAEKTRELIRQRKETVARMRAGNAKIFQRIPTKLERP